MKKWIALLLALVMILTLTACGEGKPKENVEKDGKTGKSVYYLGDDEDIVYLKNVENPLDPASIYASLEYNEKMLHGRYVIDGFFDDRTDFWNNTAHMELEYWFVDEMFQTEMTVFPYEILVGPVSDTIARIDRSQNWAELSFAVGEKGSAAVRCTYEVSGNTVTFTPVDYFEEVRNEDYRLVDLKYTPGQDSLVYTFAINGADLTLTNEYGSHTMHSNAFLEDGDVHFGGHPALDSAMLDGLESLSGTLTNTYSSAYAYVDGDLIYPTTAIKLWKDGRVTIFWKEKLEDGTFEDHMHHMVYIACGGYGMILTDGERIYYYNESAISLEMASLGQGMTTEELHKLEEMPEADRKEIQTTKEDLVTDLETSYENAEVEVSINKVTGEIAMDNTLLFDVNSYELSQEGKAYLTEFLKAYAEVVLDEKYSGFISRIIIEGHTDTNGAYDYNLELSQKRADAVLDFCLSEEAGVDEAYAQVLAQMFTAKGYSYDYPVYDENGEVDMDASRRVSFRFVVNID